VLTGGGTGGHVNPALAIAEGVRSREPNCRFLYVGVHGKAEAVIVKRAGNPLLFVLSTGFPGLKPSFRLLRFLCLLSLGVAQSIGILIRFSPRWIIATGGYVSAPVIMAALLLRLLKIAPVRIYLHEQNSIPGQLNALLGRWVDRVLLTFPQTQSLFAKNGVVVGYPVRHSIKLKNREEAIGNISFKIPEGRQVIFAFGGSQGARTINRAIVDALRYFLPYKDRLIIIHGTGLAGFADYNAAEDTEARLHASLSPEEISLLDGFYYRQDYFHNIEDIYSVSDLIVCRSGAGSLNEICRLGKPALLIPKANLPGDHQVMNARAMKLAGAADILFEDVIVENGQVMEKVDGYVLAERILRLLNDPDRLGAIAANSLHFLRKKSNERILSELYGDQSYNNGIGYNSLPLRPLMSNQRLLQSLTQAYNSSPRDYNPLSVVIDEDDLMYYRHRAAALLSHNDWQDRNLGVKLVGLTKYREKIPALLHMLADRTPDSRIKRFFGADFEQVGFIRRNIVQALKVMSHFDVDVEQQLLTAMDDPYFEVRVEACRTVAHFGKYIAGKEACLQALLKCLNDKSFDVAMEAAKALGEVGLDGRAFSTLLGLKEHFYWQVRDAGLKGIKRLLERHVIPPSPELLSEIAVFILTSTDFRPHFSIKETYRSIDRLCRERLMMEKSCSTATSVVSDSLVRKQ
jgi:UDP-N-acetylglucosamine--N-acetylmuramyl-(pentapeptide) pyrophosphoryl-undecaprenol N-acetylglucosamine transferase